ncbi:hypothetical protein ABW19_dt0202667 [Dactylella cylindrospora]|nr:hypothetical protein ABW19_dt0202667 [Dactylella cylindrospora]
MPSYPHRYNVGWICGSEIEYTAARQFLDEVHEDPIHLSSADRNTYTLGKMGKHYVVISVLPDGEPGLCSAALVAADMQHSFQNITIGMAVGTGGGAPCLKLGRDIRLGDLVVSSVRYGKSSVIQYDFGERLQGQPFQIRGYFDQPPRHLRAAGVEMMAKYEEEGHQQIQDMIDKVLENNPIMEAYKRPDPSTDRLYQADTIHPFGNNESCLLSCTDPLSLVPRPPRLEGDEIMAHYGRIGSANCLMKDALERDRLAEDEDVLCFDTEAAGLVNHFPCLVIRGISHYSDSHNQREWQGYAAMTAAAYAKSLLLQMVAFDDRVLMRPVSHPSSPDSGVFGSYDL